MKPLNLLRAIHRPLGYDLRRLHKPCAGERRLPADGARTLIDVGANIGDVAAEFRRHFPQTAGTTRP